MNHQTWHSFLCDWTLHHIIEDWATYLEDKNIELDDHYRPPYLYFPLSNNQKKSVNVWT